MSLHNISHKQWTTISTVEVELETQRQEVIIQISTLSNG